MAMSTFLILAYALAFCLSGVKTLELPSSSTVSIDGIWINWGESATTASSAKPSSIGQALVSSTVLDTDASSVADQGTTIPTTSTSTSTVQVIIVPSDSVLQCHSGNGIFPWDGEHCSQCGRTSQAPPHTSWFTGNGSCTPRPTMTATRLSGSVPASPSLLFSNSSVISAFTTVCGGLLCSNSTFATVTWASSSYAPSSGSNTSYAIPTLSGPTTSLSSNSGQIRHSAVTWILMSLFSAYMVSG